MNFLILNKIKFAFRTLVFLATLSMAIINYDLLSKCFYFSLGPIKMYQILWFILMLGMVQVCIPGFNNQVSCGKLFAKHFIPTKKINDADRLIAATDQNNKGAIRSALFWMAILILLGSLYFSGVIDKVGLVLFSVFFYFSDQFCVNVWCPFRAWLVKNKCCNACRIYNWGHFMIVSPLIFIVSFWSYSLIVASLLILFQWEWQHYKYPERFTEITNENLKCHNCLKAQCGYIKT